MDDLHLPACATIPCGPDHNCGERVGMCDHLIKGTTLSSADHSREESNGKDSPNIYSPNTNSDRV